MVRISGPHAGVALQTLAGKLPPPRTARYRRLRDCSGDALDDALILWFPGPNTATGEDLAEFHLHGGRAVVAAVLAALAGLEGLRLAEAGEFTRRAFQNGRIDLTAAEGLADLLSAETQGQRRSALALAEGGLGRRVENWQRIVLQAAALTEAALDLSDEDDVDEGAAARAGPLIDAVVAEMDALRAAPSAERLRDGIRLVLAGPPNAGKSSLFNVLIDRDAAIVTAIAGTTRDRIEAPVVIDGLPFLFIDTAGLRDGAADPVEEIGIARSAEALAAADIILWMGPADACPAGALLIAGRCDVEPARPGLAVSVATGAGLEALRSEIVARARALLPGEGALALNARHRALLDEVLAALRAARSSADLLITAEHLRLARAGLDRITGRAGVEDMLDALFGTFCVGK